MIVFCNKCQTGVFSYSFVAALDRRDVTVTAKCHGDRDEFVVTGDVPRPVICVGLFGEPKGVLTKLPYHDKMEVGDGVEQ